MTSAVEEAGCGAATRHLCVGVYLDPEFCRRVVDVYTDRSRWAAPSYGFDLRHVTAHARRAWWLETAQHVVIASVLAVGLLSAPAALIGAVAMLVTWYAVTEAGHLLAEFLRYLRNRHSLDVLTHIKVRARLVATVLTVSWTVLALTLVAGLAPWTYATAVAARPTDGLRDIPVRAAVMFVLAQSTLLVLVLLAVVVVVATVRQALVWYLTPPRAFTARQDRLNVEQSSGIVRYADYRPFVGSGVEVTTWSFALRLVGRGDEWESIREPDKLKFTSTDLVNDVRGAIEKLVGEDTETGMPGLTVRDVVFVVGTEAAAFTEVLDASRCEARRDRPDGPVPPDIDLAVAAALHDPSGPARHYLACQVRAWDGELVTTVYAHTSIQGRTLYLEFSVWTLLPTRPDFHVVDRGGWRAGLRLFTVGARRVVHLPEEVRRTPGHLASALRFVNRGIRNVGATAPRRSRHDAGARISVREEGAIPAHTAVVASRRAAERVARRYGDRLVGADIDPADERRAQRAVRSAERASRNAARAINYFQTRDVVRHWKVVERRVLAAVLDFLEHQEIDVEEYRARATQILNSGVMNVFNGPVDASGATFGTREESGGRAESSDAK